jgi:hypothetical protein
MKMVCRTMAQGKGLMMPMMLAWLVGSRWEVQKPETRTNAAGELVSRRIVQHRGNRTAFMYGLESFGNWALKFSVDRNLK